MSPMVSSLVSLEFVSNRSLVPYFVSNPFVVLRLLLWEAAASFFPALQESVRAFFPQVQYLQHLLQAYPDAHFILNVRESQLQTTHSLSSWTLYLLGRPFSR